LIIVVGGYIEERKKEALKSKEANLANQSERKITPVPINVVSKTKSKAKQKSNFLSGKIKVPTNYKVKKLSKAREKRIKKQENLKLKMTHALNKKRTITNNPLKILPNFDELSNSDSKTEGMFSDSLFSTPKNKQLFNCNNVFSNFGESSKDSQ
jgi:hypothetical protein